MKDDLEHLPEKQKEELALIRSTLLAEFEVAKNGGGGGTQAWRRGGHVQKIILFGSYARDDWIDEPENGYLSDFDILIIVSHEKLTRISDYWWVAEDKILNDPTIGRPVNIIVHNLAEVNQALGRGEYFWTDILREGVALFEVPGHPFARPRPMTADASFRLAQNLFDAKSADVDDWLKLAALASAESSHLARWRRKSAFNLHQAVETAYACVLLVHTFYFPRSHNIKFLRSLAEGVDRRLINAWLREDRLDRRRFEMLKRAYVEARYSDHYEVSSADLEALSLSAKRLRELMVTVCQERLEMLRISAEKT